MNHNPKGLTVIGLVLTVLLSLLLTFSAVMKFLRPPEMIEQFESVLGYPARLAVPIGIVELLCVVLFLVPRTAPLGAVMLTGYLGGAIATHVRIGDPFITPVIVGVVVWLALFMRDARVRALLPIRRSCP